jgi:hypothetical protein
VTEQILNLTVAEKRNLINKLLVNYQPENRIYRYNFIFDNCSTRPRDKIQESLNGYIKYESTTESKTFRQWVEFYVGTETWASFGINLAFGMPADQAATQNESMFLPEVLMNEFQHAEIINHEKQPRKLISEKKTLVLLKENTEQISKLTKPLVISIILLILGTLLTIWDLYKNQHYKPFDSFLYIITGFGGIILSYLALFSVHPLVKLNLNILWMNPINLVLGILMWFPKLRTPIFFYEILNILLLVCALIAFALSVQIFNLASFPLIVLLLLRSTAWVVYLKKRMFKRRSVI